MRKPKYDLFYGWFCYSGVDQSVMSKPKYDPEQYIEAGFHCIKRLDNGIEIALIKMLFTWDLCYNINPNSMFDAYEYRYMYATEGEAVMACVLWDGDGHPPGNWIKRKGIYPEITNPNFKPKRVPSNPPQHHENQDRI